MDIADLALLKIQQAAFGDMGLEQVGRVDTGHGWFQEVVETWKIYWFGQRLGRWWWEDLFCKVAKGRLKMGFRRPLVWLGRTVV